MTTLTIKDLLPFAEAPSRYLGSEINSIHKNSNKINLRFALAFPDVYEIGMSHFGIQILYHILNSHDPIWAERVFAPGVDMAFLMKEKGIPLCSLESHTPLSQFDIIGFSLLYELNYTNVLLMLDLAGIPFRACQRDDSHPIIIAGGPCTVNPEPMADFFDAMVVGDGEHVVMEMARSYLEWKQEGGKNKSDLFNQWSEIEGIYIPSLFSFSYDSFGRQIIHPKSQAYPKVKRAIVPDLDQAEFPDKPLVAYGRPVHDRLRLELARGCTRGCRFCQAGMIYRPVRERSLDHLLDLAETALCATGYEDISLLSLSTGDYSCLTPLMQALFARYAHDHVALSFPSFRAGTLTPELMDMIRQIRKTGFTIVPEAGSERLRAVINKNITETEVLETVSSAFQLGWKVFKLYFMIGLPSETHEDIIAIADLVKKIKQLKIKSGRLPELHVSVSTFIPKPHTPFQWEPQLSLEQSKDKIETLRHLLKIKGVHFKWQKPQTSVLEGVFARGDRRLSRLLEEAYKKGCMFDGWSDSFRFDLWEAACRECGIDMGACITKKRALDEPLPWDHVDVRISKDFLRAEYQKSLAPGPTPDCRWGKCQGCGVCDFEKLMPRIQSAQKQSPTLSESKNQIRAEEPDFRVTVFYEKRGPAKYFGHLELVHIFFRAFRRAKIPVEFSKGFHPKPKISFPDALPLGLESVKEFFQMGFTGNMDGHTLKTRINRELPQGLLILNCEPSDSLRTMAPAPKILYSVSLPDGGFDPCRIQQFHDAPEWFFNRRSPKSSDQCINLKDLVSAIELQSDHALLLEIRNMAGKRVRPWDVIRSVFDLPDPVVRRAEIIKLNSF